MNGNGTSASYLYDRLGRVVSIEHCDADGKIAESLQYCYDADGRCIRAASLLGEERYAYDNDGQLTAVEYPDGTDESFAYDAVGNRTTANGATYNVNAMNQYTYVSGGASPVSDITYDNDGNMTSLTDANGKTSYYYDTLNRLVAVTNAAAGIRWSCRYDVFGNRVSVTDNGVTTERTYLQGTLPSVAAEYVNGQLKERHIVVGAVRIADIAGTTGVSPVDSESTRYYHADLIGSTRLVTGGDGAIVDRRAYKAFGETRIGNDTASSAGYVGTLGVETDPTGLLFMRNRYYSPELGRFIQMDPIGLRGGDANQYRYCMNDSSICIDPIGLWYLSGGISAGVGGIATLGGAIGTDKNGDFIISLTGGGGAGIGLNASGSIAWDGHLKEDVTTKWVSSASFFRGATVSWDAKNQEWDTSTVSRLTTFGLGASTTMEGDVSLNVSKLFRNIVAGIKNLFTPPSQHQQNIDIAGGVSGSGDNDPGTGDDPGTDDDPDDDDDPGDGSG